MNYTVCLGHSIGADLLTTMCILNMTLCDRGRLPKLAFASTLPVLLSVILYLLVEEVRVHVPYAIKDTVITWRMRDFRQASGQCGLP